jgi:Transposase DDE domain group 1
LKVKRIKRRIRPFVASDGEGLVSRAGTGLLTELADTLGLTDDLAVAMAPTRQRRSAHDPGEVLRDLAVVLADGGDCLAHLGVLRDQPDLFGRVASGATAWRVLASVDAERLVALELARAQARARAWKAGGAPKGELVLDFDATLLTAHSEKEQASGNYKHGFGFHPLLCYLDNTDEALAGILRPGNAAAHTPADHITVLDKALAQIPQPKLRGRRRILARADSAGATHAFINALRERGIRFSVGLPLTAGVREAVLQMPDRAWVPAIRQDGEDREGADVCELTGLDLSGWPEGTRAICRREEPHPGAQLTFTDINGYRFQVFITDQNDTDIAYLEARHRGHARVENRIRCGKETGMRNLPFQGFAENAVWLTLVLTAQDLLVWIQRLCLTGEAQRWEPRRLRYCLLHVAGRLTRSGRRVTLRLQRSWPWVDELIRAFTRLRSLPAVV